jgi:hypothetical protein
MKDASRQRGLDGFFAAIAEIHGDGTAAAAFDRDGDASPNR